MGVARISAADAPQVSVVIPVYNRAALLGRAVASVLAQTYSDFEIIVVDDASTDDIGAVLAAIDDRRLRVITHPVNRGAAAARNTGVAAAVGEFVAFLDSDDLWFPNKLQHQIAVMRAQPVEVAGQVCAFECVRAGYSSRKIVSRWTTNSFARRQLFGCYSGPGSTLLCRREVFAQIGPFDAELRRLEDWDWLLRLSRAGLRLERSSATLARVEVAGTGSRRDMEAALDRIEEHHRAAVADQGHLALRIFNAALHIERAAAAFGGGDYRSAAREVLRSLAYYPLRGAAFYWRLLQHVIAYASGRRDATPISSPVAR